jgi:hypothetical protein
MVAGRAPHCIGVRGKDWIAQTMILERRSNASESAYVTQLSGLPSGECSIVSIPLAWNVKESPRLIQSGRKQDPSAKTRQSEWGREKKRRWFCLRGKSCEGTEVASLLNYLCKALDTRPITYSGFRNLGN